MTNDTQQLFDKSQIRLAIYQYLEEYGTGTPDNISKALGMDEAIVSRGCNELEASGIIEEIDGSVEYKIA